MVVILYPSFWYMVYLWSVATLAQGYRAGQAMGMSQCRARQPIAVQLQGYTAGWHTLNWIFWSPLAKASAVHCILIAVENATVCIHIWPIGFNLKKMIVGRRGAGKVTQQFPSGKLLQYRVGQSAVVERVSHSCQAERWCCKAERCCRIPQLSGGVLYSRIPQMSDGAMLSYHYIVRRCAAVVR